MGIDVSKLTSAEALKALQDGKISYEELSSLSAAEQKALTEALGGKELKVGDVLDVKSGEIEQVKPEKKEGWLKRTWKNASVLGKIGIVAAGIVGAAAIALGGHALIAAIGVGKAAMIGAGALAAGGLFASCQKDDFSDMDRYEGVNVDVTQVANVTVTNEIDTSAWVDKLDEVKEQLATIIALMTNMDQNIGQINSAVQIMLGWGVKLDQIVQMLMDNGAKLDKIVEILQGQTEQLDGIQGNQEKIAALLVQIKNLTAEGNHLTAKQNKLLARVLQEIAAFRNDANNDHAKIIELLENLVNGVGNLNDTVATGFADVLAKLGDMDYNAQVAVAEILAKLDTANGGIQNLNANQMTQIGQLADIIARLNTGNASLVEIKNLIQGLNLGTAPNLETIESLLAQILARETANGDMLTNINNNTALINASVNALKAEVTNLKNTVAGFSEQNHADLMAILNAIPTDISTCNCDCERIIQLLEEIAQNLGDGDYNHEGYRDDYNDILG